MGARASSAARSKRQPSLTDAAPDPRVPEPKGATQIFSPMRPPRVRSLRRAFSRTCRFHRGKCGTCIAAVRR